MNKKPAKKIVVLLPADAFVGPQKKRRNLCACTRVAFDRAVDFVSLNDEPNEKDVKEIEGSLSVLTASEAFGVPAAEIAAQISELRKSYANGFPFSESGLKQTRALLKISQREAAARIGVATITWTKWESGHLKMPLRRWNQWLEIFNVENKKN